MSQPNLPSRTPFQRLFPLLHPLLRGIVRLLAPRLRVTGRHNIPWRGAVIFTPNHISDGDPPVLAAAVRRPLYYMAKRELWDIPWLAPILTCCQAFPVDPESPDRAALKRAGDLLSQGEGLVIFPEGKISETCELGSILPGAVLLALRSGAPVVPVGLSGVQHLIPYGSLKLCPTLRPVRVHFGKALDLSDLQDLPGREAREIAARRLSQGIREARAIANGEKPRRGDESGFQVD